MRNEIAGIEFVRKAGTCSRTFTFYCEDKVTDDLIFHNIRLDELCFVLNFDEEAICERMMPYPRIDGHLVRLIGHEIGEVFPEATFETIKNIAGVFEFKIINSGIFQEAGVGQTFHGSGVSLLEEGIIERLDNLIEKRIEMWKLEQLL